MLVPTDPLTGAERLAEPLLVGIQRRDHVVDAQHVERALLVGERQRVLVGERVGVGLRVVLDVAAGGLVSEPLADVALGGAGTAGDLLRGQRARPGHRLIQAELLADHEQRGADDRAHVGDRLAHEGLDLCLVDAVGSTSCHLLLRGWRSTGKPSRRGERFHVSHARDRVESTLMAGQAQSVAIRATPPRPGRGRPRHRLPRPRRAKTSAGPSRPSGSGGGFRKGQALFHQGGSVRSRRRPTAVAGSRSRRATDEGKEIVLAFRGPGDLLGELSAIDGEPRSATVEAIEPVEALALSSRDFRPS